MPKAVNERSIRILIADDETILAQRLADYLTEKGFQVQLVGSGPAVLNLMDTWYPDFILYDLMLPEMNGIAFLMRLRQENRFTGNLKVIVTSGHKHTHNVQECMRLGAVDYVPKPYSYPDLLARVILQIQPKREIADFRLNFRADNDFTSANYFVHLTDLSLREALKPAATEDCLHNLTGMMSFAMKAVRVSCIRCDLPTRRGWVIASSDRRSIARLPIDLSKYPEIMYALNSQKTVALDNIQEDPSMHFVRKMTKAIHFNSMVIAPIRINNEIWGVLSVRMDEAKKQMSEFEIRYVQLVGHVMGLVIRPNPEIFLIPPVDSSGDSSGESDGSPGSNRNSA